MPGTGILEVLGAVLLAAIALALLGVGAIWARQRAISAQRPVMLCSLQLPTGRWRFGFIRLGSQSLDWYTAASVSLRPTRSWPRPLLHVGPPTDIPEPAGAPDQVMITVGAGPEEANLALSREVYFALRSWVESPPPGYHVNVA